MTKKYKKPYEEFTESELTQGLIQNYKRMFIETEAKLRSFQKMEPSKKHPSDKIKKSIKALEHNQSHIVGVIHELEELKKEYEKQ